MTDLLSRMVGQDSVFYQSVVDRVLAYREDDKAVFSAGLVVWLARKEMEAIYTPPHVQVILEAEEGSKFGEYDDNLQPIPCVHIVVRFYDPFYCKFYKEQMTILQATLEDHVALQVTPAPGAFPPKGEG